MLSKPASLHFYCSLNPERAGGEFKHEEMVTSELYLGLKENDVSDFNCFYFEPDTWRFLECL